MTSINRAAIQAIALILFLIVGSGVTSIWVSRTQAQALDRMGAASELLRNHMNADMMHDAIRADVLAILSAQTQGGIDAAESLKDLSDHTQELHANIGKDKAYTASPEVIAAAGKIDGTLLAYTRAAQEIARSAQQNPQGAGALLPPFLDNFRALEGGMSAVSDTIEAHVTHVRDDAEGVSKWSSLVIAAGLLLSSAVVLTIGIACRRHIVRPLIELVGALREMANGDLATPVPSVTRKDELGQLAGATLALRDQLAAAEVAKAEQTELLVSSIGEGLARLATGDLVTRVETRLTGPFAKLKDDFNSAITSLCTTMGQVSRATACINTGATEIRQASNDLSRRTEQQAASLEETAASIQTVTSTIAQAATDAAHANQAVTLVRDDAEQSSEVVRRAVQAMDGIARCSTEISEIIGLIDGIAFQTNLLALNAGVEAARAGEAGKGFAVVAAEVRALAQRTTDAAKEVKVRVMASGEQVSTGVQLVGETGEALERITGRIAEISALMKSIASSSGNQSASLHQVNVSVGEMDKVTQQNAAMVEQATAATRSLAEEANALAKQIERFRIEDDHRGSWREAA